MIIKVNKDFDIKYNTKTGKRLCFSVSCDKCPYRITSKNAWEYFKKNIYCCTDMIRRDVIKILENNIHKLIDIIGDEDVRK